MDRLKGRREERERWLICDRYFFLSRCVVVCVEKGVARSHDVWEVVLIYAHLF